VEMEVRLRTTTPAAMPPALIDNASIPASLRSSARLKIISPSHFSSFDMVDRCWPKTQVYAPVVNDSTTLRHRCGMN